MNEVERTARVFHLLEERLAQASLSQIAPRKADSKDLVAKVIALVQGHSPDILQLTYDDFLDRVNNEVTGLAPNPQEWLWQLAQSHYLYLFIVSSSVAAVVLAITVAYVLTPTVRTSNQTITYTKPAPDESTSTPDALEVGFCSMPWKEPKELRESQTICVRDMPECMGVNNATVDQWEGGGGYADSRLVKRVKRGWCLVIAEILYRDQVNQWAVTLPKSNDGKLVFVVQTEQEATVRVRDLIGATNYVC